MNANTPYNYLAEPLAMTFPKTAPISVVIGSGFGGLAAAIRLSVQGYRS